MLQQILKDMYIEPELLQELKEDQKHVLFFKMRQEQIRRYDEREANLDKNPKKPPKPGKKRRNVGFLNGKDGEMWVWVMGDHEDDKPIKEMVELDLQKKAALQAEKEAQVLIEKAEADYKESLLAEERKIKEIEDKAAANRLKQQETSRLQKEAQENLEICKQELHSLELKVKKEQTMAKYQQVRRRSLHEIELKKEKRSSQLFLHLQHDHILAEQEAEGQSEVIQQQWQEQEKKSKEKEIEEKQIIARAKEMISKDTSKVADYKRSDVKDWPLYPKSHEEVKQWFRDSESKVHVSLDPVKRTPYTWLHGIITRQQSEYLLYPEPMGTFLVRISHRIRGYVLSFRDKDRCKHYNIWSQIIDTKPCQKNRYAFFNGLNERSHDSLASLVSFHRRQPITPLGGELLASSVASRGHRGSTSGATTAADTAEYHSLFCSSEECFC